MTAIEFDSLLSLLKASSKQQVNNLCEDVFLCEYPSKHLIMKTVENLSIDQTESLKLLNALSQLTKLAVFHNYSSPEMVASIFPSQFHKNLKELLAKIIAEKFSQWQAESIDNMVSLPRLKSFGWRVDVKMASNDITRINTPSCILQLEIADKSFNSEETSCMNVELSKETLDAMLNGLGRIRDQLSTVARK